MRHLRMFVAQNYQICRTDRSRQIACDAASLRAREILWPVRQSKGHQAERHFYVLSVGRRRPD